MEEGESVAVIDLIVVVGQCSLDCCHWDVFIERDLLTGDSCTLLIPSQRRSRIHEHSERTHLFDPKGLPVKIRLASC